MDIVVIALRLSIHESVEPLYPSGAGGDADDVAIGRRRVLFASALGFRPLCV